MGENIGSGRGSLGNRIRDSTLKACDNPSRHRRVGSAKKMAVPAGIARFERAYSFDDSSLAELLRNGYLLYSSRYSLLRLIRFLIGED